MGAELARISHRHEGISDWLLANPHRTLGECAAELGYTQAWLSQVIHSDMFQAYHRGRAEEKGALVVHTFVDRLRGVALKTLNVVEQKLDAAPSDAFVRDVLPMTLQALGYTGKNAPAPSAETHNHLHLHGVSRERLEAARKRMSEARPAVQRVEVPTGVETLETLDEE